MIQSLLDTFGHWLSGEWWNGILAITAILAAVYAFKQLEHSRKAAKADFLLRLDAAFLEHRNIHLKLRDGKWPGGSDKPTSDEWAALDSYMGLFETIQILLNNGMAELDDIEKRYGYRVANIYFYSDIREKKLVVEAEEWKLFIKLLNDLKKKRPEWFRDTPPNQKVDPINGA